MKSWFVIVCSVVVVVVAACGPHRGGGDEIQPLVLGLMDALKPEGGTVSGYSGLRKDGTGIHAAWEIESQMDWAAYSEWVRGRVPPDFRVDSATDQVMVFRKRTEGDSFLLRLEPTTATKPYRVRATFDGQPF